MVFNGFRAPHQDQIDTTYLAIREMIAPLQQILPDLHAELLAACDSHYTPQRLGEILRLYLIAKKEQAEQDFERRESKLRHAFDRELENLKNCTKELEQEIKTLKSNKMNLETKRDDALQKVAAQNSLIVSLHQQIQNLTSGSSSE